MKKIAVFGSRKWPSRQDPALKVNELFNQHGAFILVSGGEAGPSEVAEKTAMEFGLPVISFRPVKISGDLQHEDSYGVDEWRLFRGTGQIVRHTEPTWANYESVLWFRSLMMVERADEGVAFWDGYSRGTKHEIEMFEFIVNKPLEIIRP